VEQQNRLSRVVLKTAEIRLLVVGMARGTTWPEHTASGRVVVNVASGSIELTTASGSLRLDAGMGATLEPRESHDVLAIDDAAFLLIVAG
jgi:quercetin dioxygenase-like cupin family protein